MIQLQLGRFQVPVDVEAKGKKEIHTRDFADVSDIKDYKDISVYKPRNSIIASFILSFEDNQFKLVSFIVKDYQAGETMLAAVLFLMNKSDANFVFLSQVLNNHLVKEWAKKNNITFENNFAIFERSTLVIDENNPIKNYFCQLQLA